MNLTYFFSIFISLFLHLVLVADFPTIKNGDVSVELSSSRSSFKVNLDRRMAPKKKAVQEKARAVKKEERTSKKLTAKSSISVENKYIPKYPYKSRLFGEEGSVLVKVAISKDGQIMNSHIIKSSGHERLDLAALDASKKSSFTVKNNGNDLIIYHSLEFEFKLDE